MKIKDDWINSLHGIRIREFERIFGRCPEKLFLKGLELGSGDGYQSSILTRFISGLTATDINAERFKHPAGVHFRVCDAENAANIFADKQFDIVFSSSLLEHLPNPLKALQGIHRVLKDNGVTIHCMPNPFWKFLQLSMFYPNLFAIIIEKISQPGCIINKLLKRKNKPSTVKPESFDNNPKTSSRKASFLFPRPHGAYYGNLEEFSAFSKKRWLSEFDKSGFNVVSVIKCPVASGYGFGFRRIKRILEFLGFSSSYAYIAVKKGNSSPYEKYFKQGGKS